MHWQPAGQPHAKTALVPLNASEGLFDGRGQRVVIGVEDEDSEQLCRLGLARVAADRMDRARRFGPALACSIDARLAVIHLRLDRARALATARPVRVRSRITPRNINSTSSRP